MRNLRIVFHSGCPSLHSHQQCRRPPFFPHPHQHLLLLGFSIITILTGMKPYLSVFLISISLIIDVEHLLMYLLAMCMSLKKCMFKSSVYLKWKKNLLLNYISSLYILDIKPCWIYDMWLFSHLVGYLLISLIFPFKYDVVSLLLLLLLILVSDFKKPAPTLMSRSVPPMFSSRSFMVSGLIFKSLLHF